MNECRIVNASYRPLIRVRGSHAIVAKALGPVHSWMMHWSVMDRRTQPCVMSDCPHCSSFMSRRPMSYLAAQMLHAADGQVTWVERILEVPLSTGMALSGMTGDLVTLRRVRPRGPVEIQPFTPMTPPPAVKPFPIVPTLMRIWRLPDTAQLRLLDPSHWSMWNVAND